MGSLISQINAVVAMNVKSLPQRAWMSAATVFAVAIVVAVLLAFLAMANGFQATVAGTGARDVAIAMREGAQAELNSVLMKEQVDLLTAGPGIAKGDAGPIVSPELYVVVDGIKKASDTKANLPLRGLADAGMKMRGDLKIVEGRMFMPGTNELIVGAGALKEFEGFELGREVTFARSRWTVVGVFSMDGKVAESELWADLGSVQSLFQRGNSFQTVRLKLDDPAAIEALKAYNEADPRLKLDIKSEADYFADQASGMSDLIMYLGWPLGIAMAFGALAGALNTMYTSVANRAREIATLRAIGFGGTAAFVGTLAESMVLALMGGLLGAVAAYLFFDGITASTLGGSFTQVVFSFKLSPALIWQAAVLALIIGFIGGVFPAWRAARLPVVVAFRSA
ncbi:ABC transporter permease [Gimibacter soli]|uniref:ABC transporter permease n=1 Tax=Gimibacter soli TaxID=3024400 RepID=A0AAF0BN39_9PROT|nr:ABC transporter permease [Gimibacter soli]WCL55485.1 ABC transporter permease [Gimibacter soli]